MKKWLCMLLACGMVLSVFTGCGESENVTFDQETADKLGDLGGLKLPLSEKGETIEWSVTTSHENFNDSWVADKLRKATGLDVQFRIVPAATAQEKLNVWIASKDLPDIIGQGLDDNVKDDLASQGAIAAVEDYLDELPNFKKTFADNEENSWIFKSYAAPDGKLYGFYGYDWARDINTGAAMYRKDIFDKHNIPMWNDPDSFYSAVKKLKELYPSSSPFTSKGKDGIFKTLGYSWGLEAHKTYYDEASGEWKYTDTDPQYKDMLDFMRKLYAEKLLDPEFLTLTQAAWTSKMTAANSAFVTVDWIGRLEMFKKQAVSVPDYDLRFANPIGPKQTMKETDQICWARYVANNEKAETAFKLLDFLLSPAGAELITMGVKDETYTLDENGKARYLDFSYEGDDTPDMNNLEMKYGMFVEGMYLKFDRRSSYFQFTEKEQEAQDFAKDPAHIDPLDPVLSFTNEEKDVVNDCLSKLETAGKEFATKYVLGTETGDAAWNAWVQKANTLGAQKLADIYNEAQKRYAAK